MQIFTYCKSTLHVSGVTAPIIRSIKNCIRMHRYRSYYLYRYSPPVRSVCAVTPETCRVDLQYVNICILLVLLDFYSHYNILRYVTLRYITLHYITLHYITLHYITLYYIILYYIILYYIILYYIILWDHRRICGPSLTETSLCGARLYN